MSIKKKKICFSRKKTKTYNAQQLYTNNANQYTKEKAKERTRMKTVKAKDNINNVARKCKISKIRK